MRTNIHGMWSTKALVFLSCLAGVHAAVRKGIKGNRIRARDRARGGREEGNSVTDDQIWKNFVFNEEMTLKMQPSTG